MHRLSRLVMRRPGRVALSSAAVLIARGIPIVRLTDCALTNKGAPR